MRRASTLLSIAISLSFQAQAAFAQTDTADPQDIPALETRLAEIFRAGEVPGAAVAVIENGEIALLRGYGVASLADQSAVTPDTLFRAGSISKALTGVILMQLVEEGVLSLDAPLRTVAPDVTFENAWENESPVQLVHLMEHTSGWADIPARYYLTDASVWSLQRAISFGDGTRVSRWRPGLYSSYSNAGPSVVGYAMERATGQSFPELARARLLAPLGMSDTTFLAPESATSVAVSYNRGGTPSPVQNIGLTPSSSLITSARDMARFIRLMLNRGELDGRRLLEPGSVARIERQETSLAARAGLANGYGLGNAPIYARRAIFRGHSGQIDSFVSIFAYSPTLGSGFVILANGGSITPAATIVLEYLSRAVEAPAIAPLTSAGIHNHAGIYQPITMPHDLQRVYGDLLAYRFVSAKDGALEFGGRPLVPVTGALWRRPDRIEPSAAFVDGPDGGHLMLDDSGAWQRRPAVLVWTKIGIAVLTVLCLVLGIFWMPVWIVSAFLGRLRSRGGAAVRAVPVAGLLLLAATLVLPVLAPVISGSSQLELFGRATAASWAVFASSALFPIAALLSLWLSYTEKQASWIVRSYAALSAVLLLVGAAYMAGFGWIGIRMWLA